MFTKKQNSNNSETFWGKSKETEFQFDRIDYYFRNRKATNHLQSISDQTINDIDFKKVFALVDRTQSRIGEQYLYSRLLTIDQHVDFSEQESLCDCFTKDSNFRSQVQRQLSNLKNENAYHVVRLFLDKAITLMK